MRRTRLKYYLRALGVGIVVTALLMGYSQRDSAQLTDEQIRQRAAQLGMVEQQGVLSELTDATAKPQETEELQQSAEPEESQQGAEPKETEEPQQGAGTEETGETQQTQEPEEAEETRQTAEADTVTLVIVRGDTSVSVSKALAEAGLVEDYRTYDRFLCSGGYDKSINPGTYEIPTDATDEEIARIITKKR